MCGRYSLTMSLEELLAYYALEEDAAAALISYGPRFNIAPGQPIPAVIHDGAKLRIGPLRWGLIPSWAKDEKIGWRTMNARAETLRSKPAFRLPFERKRCLIPADGFYEWRTEPDGTKQPIRIVRRDGGLFQFAGLYDTWFDAEGRKVSTCTIITTEPNELMAPIHDRMPVIVPPEQMTMWLDRGTTDTLRLEPLLRPCPADELRAYPVHKRVGNAKTDDPACIEPLS
ncbi:SOS response-associated peptidase [Paenibacillus dendritiformis]|uniref:SOS response-associated peptidase n=1 Tax=Paenibacillus dendritiformis TaxID=130049 RepID=UPI00248C12BD|nr:SOS response-associated peptidase [Paenibacillus dendritiformis]WGU96916.1 SOS response-associated peptidase [Paenibacillus dendritiformis]